MGRGVILDPFFEHLPDRIRELEEQQIKRAVAAEKVASFLEDDRRLKQRVHNLGPYAYTHIDWAARQERLEEALEALREARATAEKAKS